MKKRPGKKVSTVETVADGSNHAGESRLAQWSRRKAAARSQTPVQVNRTVDKQDEIPVHSEALNHEAVKAPTDDDMPPLESLDEHSDYSGFLSPSVSEKLRKQALRKLFHLDMYNLVDGLDDYAEDYTNFAPLGKILTADMRLQQQRAESRLREQASTDAGSTEGDGTSTRPPTESAPIDKDPAEEPTEAEPVVANDDSGAAGIAENNESGDRSENPGETTNEFHGKDLA